MKWLVGKRQQLINQQAAENLLVEEHVSFCILDAGLRHLGHTLVIKFIPQIVHVVPAVRYVVATWDQREQRESDLCKPNKYMEIFFFSPYEGANECGALAFAKAKADGPTHCWQCRGDRWLTAGRSWWSGRSRLWPGRTAGPGPPAGRRRGCRSWWRTSARVGIASSGYKGSEEERRAGGLRWLWVFVSH